MPDTYVLDYTGAQVNTKLGITSREAVNGGTDLSYVTTGEKYIWNNNTGTVTSVGITTTNGGGLTVTGGPITSSGTINIDLNSATVTGISIDGVPINNSTNLITSGAVYTAINSVDALPSQTNNSGKFLTTNGTSASWATVEALPTQTNNSGKFLTTNGTTASWASVDALPSQTSNSGKFLTTNGTTASWSSIPTDTTRAPIDSPTFTGTPAAPTATVGTNTTQIATTAFVNTAIGNRITYGTSDLTEGTSPLATGVIYLLYTE